MKHKPTIRHCERSDLSAIALATAEAIQIKKIGSPRRLRLLAMTMVGFMVLFTPSQAFACMEWQPLYKHFGAELIFEGHIARYEMMKVTNPKDQNKFFYNLINVYEVDRNWKGTKKGQEVKVSPFGSYSKDGKIPAMPIDPVKKIIVQGGRSKTGDYYVDIMDCPNTFDPTWKNRLLLFFKYPLAVFQ